MGEETREYMMRRLVHLFIYFSLVANIYTKVVIALLDISSLEGEAFNVALCEDDEQEIWFKFLIFFL